VVISLPHEALEYLNFQEGAEIEVNLDCENRQVILKPVEMPFAISGADEKFALQVANFIMQYRPALEVLANKY
jgi:antitoxin component of MazEF toxin-antitoxin module